MLGTISGFDRIGEENAFAVLARAEELAAGGKDVINLGIGQPDFPTPANIVEAAVKALRDGEHGYTPATGIPKLREAVAADIHRRFAIEVNPDNVIVVPGGKVTMFAAILMFGEPGAEILYPEPGFPIYRSMIEFTGARPVPIPIREENGFAFSAEEALSLVTSNTRLVILNSPANPCGGVTPRAEVDALVSGLADRTDVALLSDEIYDQMLYDGEDHVPLLGYPEIRDRVILLNGWSKTYAMTGWRLGYSVWPRRTLRKGPQARRERMVLRERPCPARGHRGLVRAAGRCGRDDGGIRCPPATRGRSAERHSRSVLHHAKGRILCLSEHRWHWPNGQGTCVGTPGGTRRGDHRRPRFWHPGRGIPSPQLCQQPGQHPRGLGAHAQVPW